MATYKPKPIPALQVRDAATADITFALARQVVSDETLRRIARGDVGKSAADRKIATAIELGRRALCLVAEDNVRLREPGAVGRWAQAKLAGLEHEELWALALDSRHDLRSAHMIARGGAAGAATSAADILRIMLRAGARGFILIHNHPGGDPNPSHEDIALTHAIYRAGEVVGIMLLDHVIVTAASHRSLMTMGLLKP